MKKFLFLVLLFGGLGISLTSEAAGWMSAASTNCAYYNAYTSNIRVGLQGFTRPSGVNVLCVKQEIDALEGFNIEKCAVADEGARPTNSFAPADQRCYSNCGGTSGYCSQWQGNYVTIPWGTGSITYWEPYYSCVQYSRSCTLRNPGQLTLVNGNLNHPVIDKWGSCHAGDRNPAGSLMVYNIANGVYYWDDSPPQCMPASAGVQYLNQFRGKYVDDIVLAQTIAEINTNVSSYSGNLVNQSKGGTNYDGQWTKDNIVPRSYCQDQYSGCQDTSIMTHNSTILRNRQEWYSYEYLDKVNNSSFENLTPGNQCSSLMVVPTKIDRLCNYRMTLESLKSFTDAYGSLLSPSDSAIINNGIKNRVTYGIFNAADTASLQRMYYFAIAKSQGYTDLANFFQSPGNWDSPTGTNVATNIADLGSRIGVSDMYTLPIAGFPGVPFVRDNASCSYQLNFQGGAGTAKIAPLIDRVKPTINITSEKTADNFTGGIQTILNNESNSYTSGSYYAGKITFRISLTDSGSSNYIGNPSSVWTGFNGVSGIKSYQVQIERIKTATGLVLSTPEVIADIVGNIASDGTRRTNAAMDSIPSTESILWGGVARKTGVYKVTVRVNDWAGNILGSGDLTTGYFTVVPNNTETAPCTINCTNPIDPTGPIDPTAPVTPWVPNCPNGICITTKNEDEVQLLRTNCDMSYDVAVCERNDLGVVTLTPQNPANTKLYADANATYETLLTFYDRFYNPMYNREVRTINQSGGINPYPTTADGSPALTTEMNNNGTTGSYTSGAGKTNDIGGMLVRTFSYTPGVFQIHYTGDICFWTSLDVTNCAFTRQYDANNSEAGGAVTGEFLHIFTGAIALDTAVENKINLGTENTIGLSFFPTQSPIPNSLINISLSTENFMESLRSLAPKFGISHVGSYDHNSGNIFGSAVTQGNVSTFLPEQTDLEDQFTNNDLDIRTDPIANMDIISLEGITKAVRYYISPVENYYGSGLTYSEGQLNRIYIEGYKRSQGKELYVTDKENIVNTVATKEYRNLIYKNVALLTRNRTINDGKVINGIKWVSGDVDLSSTPTDWDTLIVEDGNITFSADIFNSSKKKLAIVVLSKNDASKGNLFIKPNVRFIAANMFLDGSAFSVSPDGVPYMQSSSVRTIALQNQIVLYGNLFSKNTVGGAVKGSDGSYVLPSNINESATLDNAIKYDLSFLRMNNQGYDDPVNGTASFNDGHRESVIFLMNMDFFQDPLKIFSTTLQ